ncbi:hypothetical protein DPEC_G00030660 [Dallia pectoralis]|uniref:Uncharacterized protein n=1 Tax=Dallia pectoralis TaxID=75939 RepID=A0ACC2HDF3_DALPE|nr:hypothetical protein DPEC_G00030660 [Dallia pectoralis]
MVFSESEAQHLIEVLSDKAGLGQDTWHKATQKGDPVAVMKKHLEENQKQLAVQQEDSAAAKNKLRELTKELSAEKSKVAGVETRLSSQLSSREQEMNSLQARMQASYQDHLAQTQKLNAKAFCLLRDALNQATSQSESKQNAELAKLRQDCSRLTNELGEKNQSLQAEEKMKTDLETKVSAAEKQLSLLQDHSIQLEQLKNSLRDRDTQLTSLQEQMNQLKEIHQEAVIAAEVSTAGAKPVASSEEASLVASLQEDLTHLRGELEHLRNSPAAPGSLFEAQASGETEQLYQSLKEREGQMASLEEEVKRLKETSEQWSVHTAELTALQTSLSERESLMTSLQEELREARDQSEKTQATLAQLQQRQESQSSTELPELLEKLREAEDGHCNLQAECDQYRTVLAETEGMLKDLQKSVEEEELVWKSKMADSQEKLTKALEHVHALEKTTESLKTENQSIEKLKDQVMLLEAQLEKQSATSPTEEDMVQLKYLLSEYQSQLKSAQLEAQTYREEVVMVRGQLSEATETVHEVRSQNNQSEAQKAGSELQTQLDLLKAAGNDTETDTEDVALLKECLQKERKLSKDLGQAATKLQQLLNFSQEQLVMERTRHSVIQEHSDENNDESTELKEGTSV